MKYIYSNKDIKKGDLVLFIYECKRPGAEHGEFTYDKGAVMIPGVVNIVDYKEKEVNKKTILITPYKLDTTDNTWKVFVLGKDKNGQEVDCIQIIDDDANSSSYRIIPYNWFSHSGAKLSKERYLGYEKS